MDIKKEEALVAAEVEDADDEVDGESGDPLSSDEESRREDLVGLKMGEKQFVKAPITVFWDVRSCGIPEDCDASRVVTNIRLALHTYDPFLRLWGL